MSQHDRSEWCCGVNSGVLAATFQPCKQVRIWRCQSVPDFLQLFDGFAASIGNRLAGEATGYAVNASPLQ